MSKPSEKKKEKPKEPLEKEAPQGGQPRPEIEGERDVKPLVRSPPEAEKVLGGRGAEVGILIDVDIIVPAHEAEPSDPGIDQEGNEDQQQRD